MKKIDYSIIIPVYRGAETIEALFNAISSFFDSTSRTFEVIFVYDCGPDNSWDVICSLKNKFPELIKAVHLTRNYGQHNAIICGFKYCSADYIITMDEDLQHDPNDIELLISKQKEQNYDVVYGIYNERMHSGFRNITSSVMKQILEKGIVDLHKDYSAYRLIKSNVALRTVYMNNSYTFLDGYLTWITRHVTSARVGHAESKAGKSSYTIRKLLSHSINIFITFSTLPTRLITYSSFLIFLVSILYTIYILLRKFLYNDLIAGFTTITIITGFGFGMVVFCLGIIAEYLQRINMKTTKRPPYLEREVL